MDFLHPEVEQEYERWKTLAGAHDPYNSRETIGLHDVLRAHFLIVDFFLENQYGIGGIGPRNLDLLHSAIYRQFVGFGGKEKWDNPFKKGATLLFGLVKDHPFHDANKRTALLTALFQLDRMGRTPTITQRELENFVVDIADNRLASHARFRALVEEEEDAEVIFIADFLKRNSRAVDNRHYFMTYHQLNTLLRRYGYELVHPVGNYIDVVEIEERRQVLGIVGPKVRRQRKLCQVGFPGWKRQVSRDALKLIRRETGMTPEKGWDTRAFYGDSDPLHALIDIYAEPLRRLANR